MSAHAGFIALVLFSFLAYQPFSASAGTVLMPPVSATRSSPTSISNIRITEHPIPNAVQPGGITVAHNGYVWFTGNLPGSGAAPGFMVRYVGGHFAAFTQIPVNGDHPARMGEPIAEGPDHALYSVGNYFRDGFTGSPVYDLRTTIDGTMTDVGGLGNTATFDLTFGSDNKLYAALQLGGFPFWPDQSGAVDTPFGIVNLPDTDKHGVLIPQAITAGEDGGVWVAATFPEGNSPRSAFLYRISSAATITARYVLPNNSQPGGIVWGPDDALWYTDVGNNRIGRITTTGRTCEYTIPTRSSGLKRITVGGDGALWFTETAANKIGRITTAGRISEYPIPTRNSGPTYIAGPFGAEGARCCLNRTIWFSESNTNKIAELRF